MSFGAIDTNIDINQMNTENIINSNVDYQRIAQVQDTNLLFRPGKPQDHPYYNSYTEGFELR